MSHTDTATSEKVSKFLSVVCGEYIPLIRSAQDFFVAFSPSTIMDRVEDAELRAKILHTIVGTRIEIARKTSKRSAGEQFQIALDEKVVQAEAALELLSRDQRVQYLDHQALWNFVVETKFWEVNEADTAGITSARTMFTCILDQAIKRALITYQEIVEAIGFGALLEHESKETLIQTVELLTTSPTANRFHLLSEKFAPKKFVASVDRGLIWSKVIQPLIAERHGLATKPSSEGAPDPIPDEAKSRPIGSSPVSSVPADPLKKTGSALHGPLAGARASAVPAAQRISSTPVATGASTTDPKASETSDTNDSDVEDDDGAQVDDHELLDNERSSVDSTGGTLLDEPAEDREETNPKIEITPNTTGVSSSVDASSAPLVKRPSSSSIPAMLSPPRPSTNPRRIPAGSGDGEILVEDASPHDSSVIEALAEEERAQLPSPITTPVAHISDREFAQAGGTTQSDPIIEQEERSITSVEKKTVVCILLRSPDIGLKLDGIDMFSCQIQLMLAAALEEIDPTAHRGLRERYRETDKRELGSTLCKAVEDRHPIASIKLRALLSEIDCINTTVEAVRPSTGKKPPPLPPTKSFWQRGQKGR